ncbi:MAG: SDR family NAD(P)-dependent oxidoreductase [Gemmatimonadota bacterium]
MLSLPGLEGRRVLVTGGSRGIGRATVRLLAEAGASVGVAYFRDAAAAESIVAEAREMRVDGTFWSAAADLSVEADTERLFDRVDEEFGGLDGFVGNAGIWNAASRPLGDLEPGDWDRMIAINLTSIYLSTRAAAARMGQDGRIVLVSSTAGQRGEAGHSHYAASKGGIISFTKSIASELGPRGITVNSVAPGWVDTDMSESVLRTEDRRRIECEIPLRRVATAEDLAGPIVFLLSDLARHITGEVVNVNGGSVLCG